MLQQDQFPYKVRIQTRGGEYPVFETYFFRKEKPVAKNGDRRAIYYIDPKSGKTKTRTILLEKAHQIAC